MTADTRLPGYDLARPTPADATAFLARAMSADQAVRTWLRACREAGVAPHAAMGVDDMLAAARRLAAEPDVAGVIGNALVIRLRTYRLLSQAQGAGR
ncbi:MAG TPA: hypothetical protein VFQ45_17065 [Longimicrobium sp.]|nr:hypothetical protein [Longimicrobium sp.]